MTTRRPRILLLDLETAPNIVTAFAINIKHGLPYQNILRERYILTAAWIWFGERKIHGLTITQRLPHDDKSLVIRLAKEIAKADVIVGHWATAFDFPWIKGRLLYHKLPPLAPATELDTCKLARRLFYLNSAKLDYLGQYLGVGGKAHQGGHVLWQRCILNDHAAFRQMLKYNKHDVWLLEKIFRRMVPHMPPALNHRLLVGTHVCPTCGSLKLQRRGKRFTRKYVWARYQCQKCGAWHTGEKIGEQ
jgi:predicted RNA-binding Zn-ribbon protein involved in translation (DUF1610 family)